MSRVGDSGERERASRAERQTEKVPVIRSAPQLQTAVTQRTVCWPWGVASVNANVTNVKRDDPAIQRQHSGRLRVRSQPFLLFLPSESWGPVLRLGFKSLNEFLLLCRRRASADVPRNRSERRAALTCDSGMTPLPRLNHSIFPKCI